MSRFSDEKIDQTSLSYKEEVGEKNNPDKLDCTIHLGISEITYFFENIATFCSELNKSEIK